MRLKRNPGDFVAPCAGPQPAVIPNGQLLIFSEPMGGGFFYMTLC